MVDRSRRDAIKTLMKGTAYVSPAIYTIAAPAQLIAQGGSGMMDWMLCDWFPIICMWFGNTAAAAPPTALPEATPVFPEAPGTPPPGGQPPW
jgi:hypothetical protein